MIKNILNTVITLISIILALHYYASYCWFTIIFEQYGLTTYNLISIEDVLFAWAHMNIILSKLLIWNPLLLFSLFIIISHMPVFEEELLIIRLKIFDFFRYDINWWKIILLLIISAFYLYIFKLGEISINITWLILFITLALLWIIIIPSKRKIFIPIMIFASILMGKSIYTNLKYSSYRSEFRDYVKIKLNNGEIIETDSCRHFVFLGTKYAIFRDACSKTTELYPTSDIKEYTIKENAIPNK